MRKDFLVLFREEDGRATEPPAEVVKEHQLEVKNWLIKLKPKVLRRPRN